MTTDTSSGWVVDELHRLAHIWEHNAAKADREHIPMAARIYAAHARIVRALATDVIRHDKQETTDA